MEPNFSSISILRNRPYRYTTSCRNAALFVVQHQCDMYMQIQICQRENVKKKKTNVVNHYCYTCMQIQICLNFDLMVYYFLRPFGPKLKMCCSEGNILICLKMQEGKYYCIWYETALLLRFNFIPVNLSGSIRFKSRGVQI